MLALNAVQAYGKGYLIPYHPQQINDSCSVVSSSLLLREVGIQVWVQPFEPVNTNDFLLTPLQYQYGRRYETWVGFHPLLFILESIRNRGYEFESFLGVPKEGMRAHFLGIRSIDDSVSQVVRKVTGKTLYTSSLGLVVSCQQQDPQPQDLHHTSRQAGSQSICCI
jgi:hypothetical protein